MHVTKASRHPPNQPDTTSAVALPLERFHYWTSDVYKHPYSTNTRTQSYSISLCFRTCSISDTPSQQLGLCMTYSSVIIVQKFVQLPFFLFC